MGEQTESNAKSVDLNNGNITKPSECDPGYLKETAQSFLESLGIDYNSISPEFLQLITDKNEEYAIKIAALDNLLLYAEEIKPGGVQEYKRARNLKRNPISDAEIKAIILGHLNTITGNISPFSDRYTSIR